MEKGLYIHIPFCIKKCTYCDFYSIPDNEHFEEYIDAIEKEIILKKEYIRKTTTVYIGGGTPTILSERLLERLLEIILENIDTEKIKEITIEANPSTLNKEKVRISKNHNITRLSLGIQSMNEDELKILGRSHSVKENLIAMEMVKNSGIDLAIDLIYGIPGQKIDDWKYSLKNIIPLKPEHVSTYELTITEGTKIHRMASSRKISKPDEDTIIDMYYHGIEYLESHGFIHYEVSNFAIEGHKCLHNINYWRCGEYIGIGAGAHSFHDDKRIENIPDVRKYIDSLINGKKPPEIINHLNKIDRLMENIMLGIRMMEGIEISGIDQDYRERILEIASHLREDCLIEIDKDSIRLSKKGIPLMNEIILRFMDCIY